MSNINIEDLIRVLKKSGLNIKEDFSISFVNNVEHKKMYEETRDFKVANGQTLNLDLDEDENILSIEIVKFK